MEIDETPTQAQRDAAYGWDRFALADGDVWVHPDRTSALLESGTECHLLSGTPEEICQEVADTNRAADDRDVPPVAKIDEILATYTYPGFSRAGGALCWHNGDCDWMFIQASDIAAHWSSIVGDHNEGQIFGYVEQAVHGAVMNSAGASLWTQIDVAEFRAAWDAVDDGTMEEEVLDRMIGENR